MKPDLYTKTIITIGVAMLVLIAIRAMVTPGDVRAAEAHKYEVLWYKPPDLTNDESKTQAGAFLQNQINKEAALGWELVGTVPFTGFVSRSFGGGNTEAVFLLFRK